jgi:hypothetical protein
VPPRRAADLAATGIGGMCHVSPGTSCRHEEVVIFGKKFLRWSFLIRWVGCPSCENFHQQSSKTIRALRGGAAQSTTRVSA